MAIRWKPNLSVDSFQITICTCKLPQTKYINFLHYAFICSNVSWPMKWKKIKILSAFKILNFQKLSTGLQALTGSSKPMKINSTTPRVTGYRISAVSKNPFAIWHQKSIHGFKNPWIQAFWSLLGFFHR